MLESWLSDKNGYSSCRGPGFGSQQPYQGSRPSATPVPRDLTFSSDLQGLLHTRGAQINIQTKHPINFKKSKAGYGGHVFNA